MKLMVPNICEDVSEETSTQSQKKQSYGLKYSY